MAWSMLWHGACCVLEHVVGWGIRRAGNNCGCFDSCTVHKLLLPLKSLLLLLLLSPTLYMTQCTTPPPHLYVYVLQVLVTEGEIALTKARIASLRRQLQDNTSHVLELEAGHERLVTRRLEASQASAAAKERLGQCHTATTTTTTTNL